MIMERKGNHLKRLESLGWFLGWLWARNYPSAPLCRAKLGQTSPYWRFNDEFAQLQNGKNGAGPGDPTMVIPSLTHPVLL